MAIHIGERGFTGGLKNFGVLRKRSINILARGSDNVMGNMPVKTWHLLLAPVLMALASCGGVRLPSPLAFTAPCKTLREKEPDLSHSNIYFMAVDMPDCRGKSLQYHGYRYAEPSYGRAGHTPDQTESEDTIAYQQERKPFWVPEDRSMRDVRPDGYPRKLLVFIHGYNNSFDAVAKRAWALSKIQMGDVPLVFIRWPSRSSLWTYTYDEDSISWAQDHINQTIYDLTKPCNPDGTECSDVTLISHSMGARALVGAVRYLERTSPERARRIRKVVLASPDYDRATALQEGGPIRELLAHDREVLVYTSREDVAVRTSRRLHGFARLGSSGCKYDVDYAKQQLPEGSWCHLVPVNLGLGRSERGTNAPPPRRLSVVETSTVSKGFLGHGDFLDACPVLVDLGYFLDGRDSGLRETVTRQLPGQPEEIGYVIDREKAQRLPQCRK